MKLFAEAPIKRMSILERRPGDPRDKFLRHWRDIHGGMVAELPFLFAYNQNHVLEDFDCGLPGYPADGFVEQLWRSTAQMQRGYSSPVVRTLIDDEVNYLGHGSNYAILAQSPLLTAEGGEKLICSLRHGGQADLADAVVEESSALPYLRDLMRDDVIATIAKPNMLPVPPRPVDMFLQLYFRDAVAARAAAHRLSEFIRALPFGELATAGLHRVATHVIVR